MVGRSQSGALPTSLLPKVNSRIVAPYGEYFQDFFEEMDFVRYSTGVTPEMLLNTR